MYELISMTVKSSTVKYLWNIDVNVPWKQVTFRTALLK